MIARLVIVALILIFSKVSDIGALECPKQPEQSRKDWDTEVNLAVAKIGPATGAALKMKAKNTTHDLMGKLPGADKVYIEQMMYATYCSALRDDKTITESERAKKLKIYNLEVRKALGSSPSTPKSNKQNRTTSSKAEPEAIDENILIKHAYLLPSPGFFGFSKENKSSFYETAFLEFDLTNISSSPLLITSMSVEISKNDKILFADIVSGGAKIFHPKKNENKPILIQPGKKENIKYFQAIRLPGLAELLKYR